MKTYPSIFVIFLTVLQSISIIAQTYPAEKISGFIKGADVSSLPQIEDNGGVYKENGIQKDALFIFKNHGINYARLRIWHTPADGYCGLIKTLQLAQRIKNADLKLLLDIHYSDTWADPIHQTKPSAWQSLGFEELKDSVYQYTFDVIMALKNQNTLPDMVQLGNEIICGMLWDDGRVCDPFNTTQQWMQLAELLNEGIQGVNDGIDPGDSVKIMIHIDRGGDNGGARWFYDNLVAQNVNFDIIGLSFYPWWHGTLTDLQNNLNDLAGRYNKDIIVVETAYPWTLEWNDNTNNIVGDSTQLLSGYPATVEGQKNFLSDIITIIKNAPDAKGKGLFYWEPDWISAPSFGSPWENLALFDFDGNVLNSISVFDSIETSVNQSDINPSVFELNQNYPNPFNPSTKIKYEIPGVISTGERNAFVTLKVYDVLGNEVSTLVSEEKSAGKYSVNFAAKNLPSGVYFYRLTVGNFADTKKMMLLK
jgi:arabinogalactan endo-1,4-beta-galactosidase